MPVRRKALPRFSRPCTIGVEQFVCGIMFAPAISWEGADTAAHQLAGSNSHFAGPRSDEIRLRKCSPEVSGAFRTRLMSKG